MSLVAVCPYCSAGRLDLPDDELGKWAECPECQSGFAAVPDDFTPAVEPVAESEPPPVPKPPPPPLAEMPDPARMPALLGMMAAVGGVVGWMIPEFGRLVWLALAVSGLLAAGVAWLAADRAKAWVWAATAVAVGSVLACVLLPAPAGGWWPSR